MEYLALGIALGNRVRWPRRPEARCPAGFGKKVVGSFIVIKHQNVLFVTYVKVHLKFLDQYQDTIVKEKC